MTFTRSGGTTDSADPREVVFHSTFEAAGQHTLTMERFSTAATNLLLVSSITPATDLVHGTIYSVDLSYQDMASNPAVTAGISAVTFDTLTETPTFSAPSASSFIPTAFSASFVLPEAALGGSVKITFTRSGGISDANSPHVITYSTAFESSGSHTVTMAALSGAASSVTQVSSVTSNGGTAQDLVDGAIYSVEFEYRDAAGNTRSAITHTNVGFSGTSTIVPTMTNPTADANHVAAFSVSFSLPERAQTGTVKLT